MSVRCKPCAYCGTTSVERTKGHVIPRALYPDTLPNAQRITVPECLQCKSLWEDAEPHFRNIMVAIWNPDEVVNDSRYKSMQRSLTKCDGARRFKDFADQLVPVETPTGKREKIFPATDSRFNLVLRRIVRGLCHYHEFDSAVEDRRVICDVMKFQVPEAFEPDFTWHEISPNFFRYGYSIVEDDPLQSFWLLQFAQHIEFFGAVSANRTGFEN